MCLMKPEGTRVAEKDILVFKSVDLLSSASCLSKNHRVTYKRSELAPSVGIGINHHNEVEQGYHSWKKSNKHAGAVFIIPKGAEYIAGEQYDGNPGFVSSTIAYYGSNSFLRRWALRLGLIEIKLPKNVEKKEEIKAEKPIFEEV